MRDLVRLNPCPTPDPPQNDPAGVEASPPPAAPPDAAGPEPRWPRIRDGSQQFVPLARFGRPDEAQHAAVLKLVDAIGLHLICSEPACRRAKRCRDPDRTQLPLCFWLHRGTCRFVVAYLKTRMKEGKLTEPPPGRTSWTDESLLRTMRRAGWRIDRLVRRPDDGADEWRWERYPEMRALVDPARWGTDEVP